MYKRQPLPESQLDRFLVRTSVGYPGEDVERSLLVGRSGPTNDVDSIEPALTPEHVSKLCTSVDEVALGDEGAAYLQAIVRATRESRALEIGVSTRGLLSYARAVRARALISGRTFVTPDDVHALAVPVCAHRVVLKGSRRADRVEAEAVIRELVTRVPVPV